MLKKGYLVEFEEALNGIELYKTVDVIMIDEANYDQFTSLMCTKGYSSDRAGDDRDLCLLKSRMRLEMDGYYNFVIGLD